MTTYLLYKYWLTASIAPKKDINLKIIDVHYY